MRSNRARDTGPELRIRRVLHAQGMRYRVDWRPEAVLRTRADIAFPRQRLLIFVDGCFWHGCPTHASYPQTHSEYWIPKLTRNKERDRDSTVLLEQLGWRVLRFWEHESPESVVKTIAIALAGTN
jgi:DNA mismatch endonuclease (patch repair protein)